MTINYFPFPFIVQFVSVYTNTHFHDLNNFLIDLSYVDKIEILDQIPNS